MREKGPTKGMLVLINDATEEATLLIVEPLRVSDELYKVLTKPGVGAVAAVAKNDGTNYFQAVNILTKRTTSIGTGDGSATSFSGTLSNTPIRPTSVTVQAGDVKGVDDGSGNIVGSGVSGTVNYSTGDISVSFDTAPGSGVDISVTYYGIDVSNL